MPAATVSAGLDLDPVSLFFWMDNRQITMVSGHGGSAKSGLSHDNRTEQVHDVRNLLRCFGPHLDNPHLLQWNSKLDAEDGAGIRVALLDSGIAWTHVAFRGAQIQARDFTGSGSVFDQTGHGTNNAALLVAQGHGCFRGIAPACRLLMGKVLNPASRTNSVRAIARGLRWAICKQADIVILPMGRTRGAAIIAREIRRALAHGCICFAAAGNRGPDTFLFPARLKGVTAVSAAALDGTSLEWCCQVSQVDIYAPGESGCFIGVGGCRAVNGTSAAAVLAAGVAALQLASDRKLRGGPPDGIADA